MTRGKTNDHRCFVGPNIGGNVSRDDKNIVGNMSNNLKNLARTFHDTMLSLNTKSYRVISRKSMVP